MDSVGQKERYIYLETYGCQMNENDSERILGQLAQMNYRTTNDPERADLILLNTCSIREKAEHKVYSALGRFKGLKGRRPDTIIGVGGCVAQQQGKRLLKRLDYLDIVFGTGSVHRLTELIRSVESTGDQVEATDLTDTLDLDEFAVTPYRESPVKAFVTIMRGCNNFCSYCIVPYVRGREVSRRCEDIVAEVKQLAASGVKEITLIGQNVNSYRVDGSDISFPTLVRMVCNIDGIERVRFTTSHPKDLSEELIMLFAQEKKLCNHLHLPVQSGANAVLKRMEREYTREEYLEKISLLRDFNPDIAITTDIIVGFPGETDADYNDTVNLLETVEYDNLFSFKYSPRPMTKAASFNDHVRGEVKSERLRRIQEMQKGITLRKNRDMIGREVEVLVEGKAKVGDGCITGRTVCNRVVNFSGREEWIGRVMNVRIDDSSLNSLRSAILILVNLPF
ncbi:MAG: tRNA (N6-isopentenyl adenosine(37)-C2)-methylthiotransferase MiaB, partial [Thermodesulfobacteriota bacterium]